MGFTFKFKDVTGFRLFPEIVRDAFIEVYRDDKYAH